VPRQLTPLAGFRAFSDEVPANPAPEAEDKWALDRRVQLPASTASRKLTGVRCTTFKITDEERPRDGLSERQGDLTGETRQAPKWWHG